MFSIRFVATDDKWLFKGNYGMIACGDENKWWKLMIIYAGVTEFKTIKILR